jgi:hypothetical protein
VLRSCQKKKKEKNISASCFLNLFLTARSSKAGKAASDESIGALDRIPPLPLPISTHAAAHPPTTHAHATKIYAAFPSGFIRPSQSQGYVHGIIPYLGARKIQPAISFSAIVRRVFPPSSFWAKKISDGESHLNLRNLSIDPSLLALFPNPSFDRGICLFFFLAKATDRSVLPAF